MSKFCKLEAVNLKALRKIDPRLMSYNIEMTEITGGTFWKAYTPEEIAGTESFKGVDAFLDYTAMEELVQYYPPIDLTNPRLRKLAKELGTAWVRVSGSWATETYYDFDGHTSGKAPEGYQSVLTREQWIKLLDFVKEIDGKLLVSMANCEGLHHANEPWNPSQAEQIFALSKEYGVPINAVEFVNEPNPMDMSGLPKGYTPSDYVRDHDLFCAWVRRNYPDTILVGPCSTRGGIRVGPPNEEYAAENEEVVGCRTELLLDGTNEPLDVFSYHFYNGGSERLDSAMPGCHWQPEQAHTEDYLNAASLSAAGVTALRDKYVPNGQMWVTEAGDACGGGNTWASTYLDVLRTLNELGSFATVTDGIIFHNTLASSDYGFLKHGTFEPRPNYFAVLLWNRLMGTTVFDAGPTSEGAHIYVHSRKDGKEGVVYLIINNSLTEATTVTIPRAAEVYTLSAETIRDSVMLLNGKPLVLGEGDTLPVMEPIIISADSLDLAPASCTFIVL